MNIEQERAAFEVWFNDVLGLERTYNGYKLKAADNAWEAWLARAALNARQMAELEKKREPLSEQRISFMVMEHLGPSALNSGKMSVYDAFILGVKAIEAEHGIGGGL